MNPGVLSIRYDRVVLVAMALVLAGGIAAYMQIGRLEDPEFTIKEALIVTPYPGASPEEVALEVTNPIESACQQLGQLKRVESESSRGRSVVTAVIQDRFHQDKIPQVWDELRRKIADVQPQLPPSVRGQSMVIDDFGDVYGIFLAITGDGYTQAELRRYVEFLRRELLLVPSVKKVDLFGQQQEVVFLEISRQRLAQLGIPEEQIYGQLQARNVAADGGRVRVGDQHLVLDPKGGFRSAEDMLGLVIGSDQTGRQLFLRDVATLERGDQDPPRRLLRFDGKPAIGLGISTVPGGNVVKMGEGVRRTLEALKQDQPIGIEIGEINFQPEAVSAATNDFVFNLVKAVSIVFVVLIFAMGRKTGLIIGLVLFLTIMATFLVMQMKGGLLLERISLGALIIALCMLTDNAIIVIEGIKVGIEAGEDKLKVVRETVAQNQWPLFGATAIGVIAFAAIGLSEDRTGEYCNSLFWVILISLSLSWISSVTITPLLSYRSFKPLTGKAAGSRDPYASRPFQIYRGLLVRALRFRWAVVAGCVVAFAAALYGFTKIEQSFFPPATRPQFMVDVFLPAATHIRETEALANDIQRHIRAQPGVTHVTSFIGGGGLRFLLVYSPEGENRAFVQFLVDVDDSRKIDGLMATIQNHLDEEHPNANAVVKKFLLGPGQGGRIQVRFQGPDPRTLRALADQAKNILEEDGAAPVAGRMIPLNQVTSGAEVVWEDPVVMRRDRFPAVTIHADPRSGLPSQLFNRVRRDIEQIELPAGYSLQWGGEYQDSRDARAALARPLPYVLALMVFIVVLLFNSIRATLLPWMVMPLAIIGVTAGLLLTGMPFGFMALLGVLSLGGEQIKNQIVVLSKIVAEKDKAKSPYQAILDGSTSKMRPVCMVAITTVLGMTPLLTDPFFGAMAVCIMFGLSFASVLSLIVTPVLYAIFFNVHEPAAVEGPPRKARGDHGTAEIL